MRRRKEYSIEAITALQSGEKKASDAIRDFTGASQVHMKTNSS
jgi:hypothetical protein